MFADRKNFNEFQLVSKWKWTNFTFQTFVRLINSRFLGSAAVDVLEPKQWSFRNDVPVVVKWNLFIKSKHFTSTISHEKHFCHFCSIKSWGKSWIFLDIILSDFLLLFLFVLFHNVLGRKSFDASCWFRSSKLHHSSCDFKRNLFNNFVFVR